MGGDELCKLLRHGSAPLFRCGYCQPPRVAASTTHHCSSSCLGPAATTDSISSWAKESTTESMLSASFTPEHCFRMASRRTHCLKRPATAATHQTYMSACRTPGLSSQPCAQWALPPSDGAAGVGTKDPDMHSCKHMNIDCDVAARFWLQGPVFAHRWLHACPVPLQLCPAAQ